MFMRVCVYALFFSFSSPYHFSLSFPDTYPVWVKDAKKKIIFVFVFFFSFHISPFCKAVACRQLDV
jgi:hypothetical protein